MIFEIIATILVIPSTKGMRKMTSYRMTLICFLLGLFLNSAYSQTQAGTDKKSGRKPKEAIPAATLERKVMSLYNFTLPDPTTSCPDSAGFQAGARTARVYDFSGRPIESVRLCGDNVVSTTIYVYNTTRLLEIQTYEYEKDHIVSATSYEYDADGNIRIHDYDWDMFPLFEGI